MFVLGNVFASGQCSTLIIQYAAVAAKLAQHSLNLCISDPIFLEDGTINENSTVQLYANEASALLRVPDGECEGIFGLLLGMICNSSFSDLDRQYKLMLLVITKIESSSSERITTKIRMLNLAFNALVPECSLRAVALRGMVKLAMVNTKNAIGMNLILNSSNLGCTIEAIEIPYKEKIELLEIIASGFKKAKLLRQAYYMHVSTIEVLLRGDRGISMIIKNLKETEIRIDEYFLKQLCQSFVGALCCSLSVKQETSRDLDLSSLRVLINNIDTKNKVLLPGIKVLDSYVLGDIQEFRKVQHELVEIFNTDSTTNIKTIEKKIELVVEKIRMIYISHLPVGEVIYYVDLAKSLDCKEKEVEEIIINAINYNLISGRLDPINKSFTPTVTESVGFSIKQWENLKESLELFKKGLKKVEISIENIGKRNEDNTESSEYYNGGGFLEGNKEIKLELEE